MKIFFKKYFKFNTTNVSIVLCAVALIISICTGDYFSICGWVSAFFAWFLVAFIENWNDDLLDERFELTNKLTDLCIKNINLDYNKELTEKDIKLLKQCSSEEITHLKNVVLKMQEENERLQKLLNELKNEIK
jgi:hypothetical protein